MSDGMESVPRRVCEVLHVQLDARCIERHKRIDDDMSSFKGEIREIFHQRATDRAWGIVGKYGVTLITLVGGIFAIARFLKVG